MLKVKIGGVPEHFNYPWHLATESKAFSQQGIDLDWTDYGTGTGAMCGDLNNGKLDMAVILTEGAVNALAHKADFRIIKTYVQSPLLWGIHVPKDSKINSINDINGQTYAISRYGSGSHLMAIVDAQIRGWETANIEFKVVNNLLGAVESFKKKESSVFFWEKYTTKPYVDSGDFKLLGIRPTPWPSFVLVANNKFLEKHKNTVLKISSTVSEFCRIAKEEGDHSIKEISKRYGLLPKDVKSWFKDIEWSYTNEVSKKDLQYIAKILYQLKLTESIPKSTSMVSGLTKLK
ncbi:MAG: ABC transporter substrate-binding protein [Patescibacteria group bacterium]|nr:MAG: ABC transporter substrate-binding protein [Patescibacteria group bacterium]